MGRRSTLTQLDEPIQAEVARLVRAGWTIDDIKAQLAQLGADVSRSAVGRYVKTSREAMKTYIEGQEMSKLWLDRLENDPNGDVGRLLPEMLRAVAYQTLSTMGASETPIKPNDVMVLAKALKDLSGTAKDTFAIERARADARMRLAVKAAEGDAKTATATLTPEQAYKAALAHIRRAYGLVEDDEPAHA